MRLAIRAVTTICLLLALAMSPVVSHASAETVSPPVIAVLDMEPAPPLLPGDRLHMSVFVRADVQVSGPTLLHLYLSNLALVDDNGVAYAPSGYKSPTALQSEDLIGPAHANGWLLFTVPVGTQRFKLVLEWTPPGKSNSPRLIGTASYLPVLSSTWRFAEAARPALRTFLIDEARLAGSVRLAGDPTFTGSDSAALSRLDRPTLRRLLATLVGDRNSFERVPAAGPALAFKARAGQTLDAAVAAMARVLELRDAQAWAAWQAQVADANHVLADLYETWPGTP